MMSDLTDLGTTTSNQSRHNHSMQSSAFQTHLLVVQGDAHSLYCTGLRGFVLVVRSLHTCIGFGCFESRKQVLVRMEVTMRRSGNGTE